MLAALHGVCGAGRAEDRAMMIRSRFRHWAAVIAEFALAQGFGQAAGMLAGFIYVRMMPVEQYALYAICLSALSVAAIGSDFGLTGSLAYFWRKYERDPVRFAPMLALVRKLRGYLVVGALGCAAAMILTSSKTATSSSMALASCVVIVSLTAWLQTRIGIDILVLRLKGDQRRSYLIETTGSAVRLATAALMAATAATTAWFGLLGGLLAAAAASAILRRERLFPRARSDAGSGERSRELRAYIRPIVPAVLVYLIQDPLVVWLTALKAGVSVVAEVHALGRIGALFSLIGAFSSVVMGPRLARIAEDHAYNAMTIRYLAVVALCIGAAIGAASLFPGQLLAILGANYTHLSKELLLTLCSAGIASLTWFLSLANRGRAWTALDSMFAVMQVLVIGVSTAFWRFDSALDVISLTILLNSCSFAWVAIAFVAGVINPGWVQAGRTSRGG